MESVQSVVLVKKVKKDFLVKMEWMDCQVTGDHKEAEVLQEKWEMLVLLECLANRDQW